MSLESDQLEAMQALVDKSKDPRPFIGTVVSADPDPLQVVVDGTSVPVPAISFTTDQLTSGLQVIVLPVGPKYVVLGAVGTYTAPSAAVDTELATVATADVAYSTSNTAIFSVPLTVGTWAIKVFMGHQWVGSTDQIGQLTFSGSQSMAQFDFSRITVSAVASGFGNALASDMNFGQPAGLTQSVFVNGGITVTADGTLSFTMRRVAGTSALVRKGSNMTAMMV